MHFWPFYCYFGPFCHFKCKMKKNAFLRPKKAEIKKSEESGLNFFFDFTWKYVPQLFWGAPWAEKMTLSFNFACFWSSNTSSHNLGVMWRRNQKRKSGRHFFSLDLPNGQAGPHYPGWWSIRSLQQASSSSFSRSPVWCPSFGRLWWAKYFWVLSH